MVRLRVVAISLDLSYSLADSIPYFLNVRAVVLYIRTLFHKQLRRHATIALEKVAGREQAFGRCNPLSDDV